MALDETLNTAARLILRKFKSPLHLAGHQILAFASAKAATRKQNKVKQSNKFK
jgi:hypothetical protein